MKAADELSKASKEIVTQHPAPARHGTRARIVQEDQPRHRRRRMGSLTASAPRSPRRIYEEALADHVYAPIIRVAQKEVPLPTTAFSNKPRFPKLRISSRRQRGYEIMAETISMPKLSALHG
ncbi:hypothetical protein [Candidatus Villigracilis affinis]|uniref:hypothetical protein n=1 Tax=Candidatus Villigracilis affinis TaxID=3140682 RepID=UPI002A1BA6E2|nr:hypothetical protein [Anaerolineales bacterium]